MNTEAMDLERRAARHAALADPARLRIVDSLGLGDLSPTELQSALGVSSSLLAHHLGVLETAGLVERHRSEADRRRSYVSLVPDAFDEFAARTVAAVPRVLFVCTANSARSQLAEALWRQRSDVPVASAGTHPAARIHPGAVATARRHGIALDGAPAALDAVVRPGDFVVTVCDVAHEELPTPVRAHWSIPDPVRRDTRDAFDTAYAELARRIDDLAPRLTAA